MATRRPLVNIDGTISELPSTDNLKLGDLTVNTSALTVPRTVSLPNKSGTLALTSDLSAGDGAGSLSPFLLMGG